MTLHLSSSKNDARSRSARGFAAGLGLAPTLLLIAWLGAFPASAQLAIDLAKAETPERCQQLVPGADLQGCDLCERDLRGLNLRRADLRGANLAFSDLEGADLFAARLDGANLSYANLRSINLEGATLTGADLRLVDLSGANLFGADLSSAELSSAILLEANLNAALWRDAVCPDGVVAEAASDGCTDSATGVRIASLPVRLP